MIREEAIETLKENVCSMCAYFSQSMASCDIRACDNRDAIKALEQEFCEDAISRQAVLDLVNSDWKYEGLETDVASLPSVRPKEKIGHWIVDIEDWLTWECSCCGYTKRTDVHVSLGYNYCPKCGAKMGSEE